MFDQPWEDTIIMALRDLQWRKALEKLTSGQKTRLPAPLIKLDGNPETALGDVVTSADDRFFLFEFKGDDSNMGSEPTKPLVSLMKDVDADAKYPEQKSAFVQLSRRTHHFVFPVFKPKVLYKRDTVPVVSVEVGTAFYYDAAVAMTDSTYKLANRSEVSRLIYEVFETPNEKKKYRHGLQAGSMALYIKLLTQAHRERTGALNIPMKAVVLSDRGFIWPCADMNTLEDIMSLLEVKTSTRELVSSMYAKLADIVNVERRPAPTDASPPPASPTSASPTPL